MRQIICLIVSLICFAPAAWAAEITETDSDLCQTALVGQILKGDAKKLRDWYVEKGLFEGNVHGEALCLDGPGGALAEALRMGSFLYDFGIRTRLEKDSTCLSACAVLFMMGTEFQDHGSGDGSNADRRMHVTAQLGFHRPELRLPKGGSVSNAQLSRAYDLAIETALEYIRLANLSSGRETMIPSDLIEAMMARRGEDYFFIDTVGKAGRWNIGLEGAEMPRAMDKVAAVAACNNLAMWQLRYEEEYVGYDPEAQAEVVTKNGDRPVYAVMGDLGAMDAHHDCLLRLRGEGEFLQLEACGFMDAENVLVGIRRCESISQAEPLKEAWQSDLLPVERAGRMVMLPPGTPLRQADMVARQIEARAARGSAQEPGLRALRARCAWLSMSAEVRGVKNYTNLRAAPGFDADVIGEIALGERVTPLDTEYPGWVMPDEADESCRTTCGWMTPGPGGIKALYSAGGDFDVVNQCFESNQIWYRVQTVSGLRGYVSGKFLRY